MGRLEKFIKNPPREFWVSLGQIAKQGVIENFKAGADLSTGKTWEKKKDGKPSKLTGKSKMLRRVVSQAGDDFAAVGTNRVYGQIHHFGGLAGRGRKAMLPARPWLTLSEDTKRKIAALVSREIQISGLS